MRMIITVIVITVVILIVIVIMIIRVIVEIQVVIVIMIILIVLIITIVMGTDMTCSNRKLGLPTRLGWRLNLTGRHETARAALPALFLSLSLHATATASFLQSNTAWSLPNPYLHTG